MDNKGGKQSTKVRGGNKYGINPFARDFNPETKKETMEVSVKPNYCEECDLIFSTNVFLMKHQDEYHGSLTFECSICKKTFNRHVHLKRHMRTAHAIKRFNCTICKEKLPSEELLVEHIRSTHSSWLTECQDCPPVCCHLTQLLEKHNVKREGCPHCDVTFKRRDHMLRHVKSQHLNLKINCPICSQPYRRSDHLTRHLREKHNMNNQ